jgi:hypothetical protein
LWNGNLALEPESPHSREVEAFEMLISGLYRRGERPMFELAEWIVHATVLASQVQRIVATSTA